MSLEDLGNVGEFIGAIAVVLSLPYLAGQIRQNTRSVRSDFLLLSTFRVYEDLFYQNRESMVDRKLWLSEEKSILAILRQPGVREWWKSNVFGLTDEFRAHIERVLSETQ